jgi:hypothetical protein
MAVKESKAVLTLTTPTLARQPCRGLHSRFPKGGSRCSLFGDDGVDARHMFDGISGVRYNTDKVDTHRYPRSVSFCLYIH